jgi:hypothetical protein
MIKYTDTTGGHMWECTKCQAYGIHPTDVAARVVALQHFRRHEAHERSGL